MNSNTGKRLSPQLDPQKWNLKAPENWNLEVFNLTKSSYLTCHIIKLIHIKNMRGICT